MGACHVILLCCTALPFLGAGSRASELLCHLPCHASCCGCIKIGLSLDLCVFTFFGFHLALPLSVEGCKDVSRLIEFAGDNKDFSTVCS